MRQEVAAGLARRQKEISPKFFYDQRGSELFEAITSLPEYYPTRAERILLHAHPPGWIEGLGPRSLVELGAGAAEKTRILLDILDAAGERVTYVPIDISADFLEDAAAGLRADYPAIRIRPVAADMTAGLPLPSNLARPALFALLGGTIGNFRPSGAAALLGRVRNQMHPGDALLMGVDLEKPVAILEAAYNDDAGVTAEFNLNALRVLNRELGADFDPDGFRHSAFYNADAHRIEMHLVASRPMIVTIPGAGSFEFAAGESLRTEISCKYDRPRVDALLRSAGLSLEKWVVGDPGFALAWAR